MISKSEDQKYIDSLVNNPHFFEAPSWVVNGIEVDFPLKQALPEQAHLLWQRRVIDDILPDSPNADAAEKIPFEIIDSLTADQEPHTYIDDAFDYGLEPLSPLFILTTQNNYKIPIAFHILPTKANKLSIDSKTFTENIFLLLLARTTDFGSGFLDLELLQDFITKFKAPLDELDLAQQVFLSKIHPNWTPDSNDFDLQIPETHDILPPFMEDAAKLFRRDLRTLIDANLSNSEFFNHINQLLALHLGLYQPRLAKRLNPAVEAISQALLEPHSIALEDIKKIERGQTPETNFIKSLYIRGPSGHHHRPIRKTSPEHRSYETTELELNKLHFSFILFHRIRDLSKTYLIHNGENIESAINLTRWPSDIIWRIQNDSKFRLFLHRSALTLAIRYAKDQLDGPLTDTQINNIYKASSGLHALQRGFELYNRKSGRGSTNTRANKQGIQITNALLNSGDYGIINARRGLGKFFEFGAGLIPLFLILILRGREKIRVEEFWRGLEEYGFNFADEEKQLLLDRLKAMALYERFSDAGEANYIRNILTTNG